MFLDATILASILSRSKAYTFLDVFGVENIAESESVGSNAR